MSALVRIFSLPIVLATIAVNMFALSGLLEGVGFADTEWRSPISDFGNLYSELAAAGFAVANSFVSGQFGFDLPGWSTHAFVLYASTALAVAASGMGVTQRQTFLGGLGAGSVSLSWPLSVWGFVTQAFRGRTVSTFARDHSVIFWLYMLTVAAGYGGARYYNANYLPAPEEVALLQMFFG